VVGLGEKISVQVNFGDDLEHKPFMWAPGNTSDFDAEVPITKS